MQKGVRRQEMSLADFPGVAWGYFVLPREGDDNEKN